MQGENVSFEPVAAGERRLTLMGNRRKRRKKKAKREIRGEAQRERERDRDGMTIGSMKQKGSDGEESTAM